MKTRTAYALTHAKTPLLRRASIAFCAALFCASGMALTLAGCSPESPPPSPASPPQIPAPPAASTAPPEATVPLPSPTACTVTSPVFGSLTLLLPGGSKTETKDLGIGGQVAADIAIPGREHVLVKLTLLGPDMLMPDFGQDDSLKNLLEDWWKGLGATFAQKVVPAQRIERNDLRGFYATAQDPASAPNGYPYAWNGIFCKDGVVFSMGALGQSAEAVAPEEFIALLDSATWQPIKRKPGGPSQAASSETS